MPGTTYRCAVCGCEQVLAIRPSDAERSIRAGCDTCERVTRQVRL